MDAPPLPPAQTDGRSAALTLGNLLLVQTSARGGGGPLRHRLRGVAPAGRPCAGRFRRRARRRAAAHGARRRGGRGGTSCAARSSPCARSPTPRARSPATISAVACPSPTRDDELQGLSVVLNQMIGRLDEAFQHSRRFTADASHELRTPADDHARGTRKRDAGTRPGRRHAREGRQRPGGNRAAGPDGRGSCSPSRVWKRARR